MIQQKKDVSSLFQELMNVLDTLRGENGCPWDRQQTRESLKPLMLEELYEAFEAIDRNDEEALKEELGDMLLHIAFHARIGKEKGTFSMADVLSLVIAKMKNRHPHVFGTSQVGGVGEVLTNWEKIKEEEKGEKRGGMLASLPRHLPSLLLAHAIQSRVARVGFDWEEPSDVMEKVFEELEEFKKAWSEKQQARMEQEWGDLVFSLVNLARHLEIEPEDTLRKTCQRFSDRFSLVEKWMRKQGKELSGATLEELDALWNKAKHTMAKDNSPE